MITKNKAESLPDAPDSLPGASDNGSKPEAEEWSWDSLGDTLAAPSHVSPIGQKLDIIAVTPAVIRQRVEMSLMKTVARYAAQKDSTAKRVHRNPYWSIQPVPDQARGDEFVKKATRYAKYRPSGIEIPFADADSPKGQITVRAGKVGLYRKTEDGTVITAESEGDGTFWGVRFSARPFEARGGAARLPGS